jgi:hypothetical protein
MGGELEALVMAMRDLANQKSLDTDVLGIAEVALMMRCSVDTVRRIPHDELPVYRVGRENLYFREDVVRFVRTRHVSRTDVETVLADVLDRVEERIPSMIDSELVGARRRSKRRAS